jgi:MFS family permease
VRSFALLLRRRFGPLFVTQFLGAFNGNLFKNATIALIVFRLGDGSLAGGKVLATMAPGMFVLPFLLFSATAGQIADRTDKARLIRLTKILEVAAAVAAAVAFGLGSPDLMLVALFLLGTQAAFFGPLKYGILPDHLAGDQLLPANGLVEASTFIAILAGTMAGNLSILAADGILLVQVGVVATALLGLAASLAIPPAPPVAQDVAISVNFVRATASLLRWIASTPTLLLPMLGVSWFWLVGAVFITQFAAFAHDVLGGDSSVVALFLATFTVGIALGSLLCPRLLKGRVTPLFAPWALLGMGLFGLDFARAAAGRTDLAVLLGAGAFLAQPVAWRLLADLGMIAGTGGLFVVPLYTLLQSEAPPDRRARVIAANNVMNALFMVAAATISAVLLAGGCSVRSLLTMMAAINLLLAATLFLRQRPAGLRS